MGTGMIDLRSNRLHEGNEPVTDFRDAAARYEQAMRIHDADIDTAALAHHALNWPALPNSPYTYTWETIATDVDDAHAFYATITDFDELRSLAVEALYAAGWTLDLIQGY